MLYKCIIFFSILDNEAQLPELNLYFVQVQENAIIAHAGDESIV